MRSALARSPEPTLVEGEFAFTQENFAQIAALLYQQAGISLSDTKATLVYSRLAKRVRALGLYSFDDYCDLVASEAGEEERGRMLNALTTNLTRFFREPHHFDHLRDQVLAPRIDRVRAGGRLRIWSAGCSSGQEPFSIAITILSLIPNAADLDVKVLATDIDTNMIAEGAAGIYAEETIEPIPASLRSRWLERDPSGCWRLGAAPRALVAFKPLNLMAPWPVKGPFQAIFCRNVVIYFDEPTQEKVWSRFAPLLEPGGRLYIGHSERLGAAAAGYVSDGLTVYRTRAASENRP
jgi:chemotaxis protein methyltransferase CheR